MPLTKEQFTKARKAGFSLDEIKDFERTPLSKEQFFSARKAGFSPQEIVNIKSPKDLLGGIGEKISQGYQAFQKLPGIKQGDVAVETLAKAIEPTVPPGVSNLGLAARLPQQMVSEFVRGY